MIVWIAQAQDSQNKQPCWRVSSFSISVGFSGVFMPNTISEYNDLKNLVEDPDLLIDPAGYNSNQYYSDFSGSFSPKISLGITPYSKKLGKYRDNRELRLGIGSNFGIRRSYNFYKYEAIVVDTFQSVNGNPNVYADSLIHTYYSYNENIFDLNFSISYIFKTNTEKRVQLYAGVGAEYGISVSYYLTVDNYENQSLYYYNDGNKPDYESVSGYYPYYYYGNEKYTSNTTKSNMKNAAHFVRAYIPMGINFRLSDHNSFFKHVNIYSEFSPGIEFMFVKNEDAYINPYMGVAIVGFSYKF